MFQETEHSSYLESAIKPYTESNSSRKDPLIHPTPLPAPNNPMPCFTVLDSRTFSLYVFPKSCMPMLLRLGPQSVCQYSTGLSVVCLYRPRAPELPISPTTNGRTTHEPTHEPPSLSSAQTGKLYYRKPPTHQTGTPYRMPKVCHMANWGMQK